MATKRERQKKAIRYASAKDRADKRDSGFEPTTFTIPEGKSKFYFNKAGVFRLDVLPYVVGKGNPFSDEGMMYYERTFFVHNQIGPDNERLVCPKKTFGKPCPVCEYATKARRDPSVDKEFLKELQPKERQLWNVIDLNNPSKGVQVMDQPTFFFGKLIDAKIKDADEDDNYENFFHLEGGMTLKVSVEESSFNGITFYKPSNIEMKPRKEYGEEILEETMCLDALLKEPDYKTTKKLFLQMVDPVDGDSITDDEDEDDDDSPPAKSSRKVLEIDDDEDEEDEEDAPPPAKKGGKKAPSLSVGDRVIYEGLEAEVIKISKDGTSLTLKDEEGEIHTAVGPDEVEVSFSVKDKPVEKPKDAKPRRGAKPPVDMEDDDDDDDDMDDDDEDEDEDDDMEMDDDDEEEEEEDIPPPPRRRGRPPRK